MTRGILLTVLSTAMGFAQIVATLELPPADVRSDTGNGSIEGTVVNDATGEPLKKAQVTLFGAMSGKQPAAVTDASGSFAFHKLPAGTYTLNAMREGFDENRAVLLGDNQRQVTLTDDQKQTAIELRLPPTGAISGRLTDEAGDGAPNCTVVASVAAGDPYRQQSRSGSTDDHGEYRISNLSAGRYIVYQQCHITLAAPHGFMERGDPRTPEWAWVPGFYGGAENGGGASVIMVHGGEEVHGIDFRMKTANAFTVPIILEPDSPGIDLRAVNVQFTPRDVAGGRMFSYGLGRQNNGGPLRATGVVPGSYIVTADFQDGMQRWHGEANVDVGETAPDPVRVPLSAGMTITGDVKAVAGDTTEGQPPGQGTVGLRRLDSARGQEFLPAQSAPDGTFTISGVTPGRYALQVMGSPATIESVTFGGHEVSPQAIDIPAGGSGQLHVTTRASQVALQVSIDGLSSDRATWLIALPKDFTDITAGVNPPLVQAMQSPSTMQVPPGEYNVYAVECVQPWPLLANASALHALASQGKSVEVKEGGSASATVKVIGHDDLKRAVDSEPQ